MPLFSRFAPHAARLADLRRADVCLTRMALRHLWHRLGGRSIFAHQGSIIRGASNIHTHGNLWVGTGYVGFLHNGDRAYLNIHGRLEIHGSAAIGKGCRLDIGSRAVCRLTGCHLTGDSRLIIMNGLEIGQGSTVSWGCEFLDEDFHRLDYDGRVACADPRIVIGERVWIGSGCRILKGTRIASGSVVAAGAIVSGVFEEENVLIAGAPARVIRRGVRWE